MRGVEMVLLALVVAATVATAYRALYTAPTPCPRCHVDASIVAAWLTMVSSSESELAAQASRANATLSPSPGDYTAPALVWANGTPLLYTVGWRP